MPVGSFPPNEFGLHDVHGNVWEWVEDCLHVSYNGAPSDGSAWTSGGDCSERVVRGGSWVIFPRLLRSAYRSRNSSAYRLVDLGFRVAGRSPHESSSLYLGGPGGGSPLVEVFPVSTITGAIR